MKSGKQRRAEIKAHRLDREALEQKHRNEQDAVKVSLRTVPCDPENLAPYNSYGMPEFVACGYYADRVFQCASCKKQEIWTATRQKWWYEVAKGSVESRAKLCNPCRKVERERRAEARRVHLEGVAAKLAKRSAT